MSESTERAIRAIDKALEVLRKVEVHIHPAIEGMGWVDDSGQAWVQDAYGRVWKARPKVHWVAAGMAKAV